MDNQKFEAILDRLIDLSESGQLNWKSTAGSATYLLVLKDSSISISGHSPYIFIEFRNEKGVVVEKIVLGSSEKFYEKADKLFDLARRKALNADETIDRILEQLNTDSIAA